ncbi:Glutathione S-transferase omega-1 [Mactra antiquata]
MPTEKAYCTGSEFPPLEPGVLRLYSMRLCPFAQRSRILLVHKKIPHETININLSKKPEWYLEKINQLGKVPAIQKDDRIVFDSAIVNDYIDVTYPGEKLTPDDPYQQAKDRMFMEKYSQVIVAFYKIFYTRGKLDAATDLLKSLDLVEKELKTRKTPFFGGKFQVKVWECLMCCSFHIWSGVDIWENLQMYLRWSRTDSRY